MGPVAITREKAPTGFLVVLRGGMAVLRDVLKELEEFPLIRVLASQGHSGEHTCYVIVDAKGRMGSLERVAERIRSVEGVEDVKVYRPLEGLLTTMPFDILEFSGQRAVVFVRPFFTAFVRTIQESLGPSGSAILYHMGVYLGREAFRGHLRFAGDKKRALFVTRDLFGACGLGKVEIAKLDEMSEAALVRVWNNFECELFAGSGRPSSHFIRGVIAGWLSAYFDKEMYAEETRCIAMGDDVCEFRIEKQRRI